MSLTYIICLNFFSVITIFDATKFCGDFNGSSFLYLTVIILLINSLQVCGTFPFLVCTVIKLGHKITFGNCKTMNITKQSFWATWSYYNIEFIEVFHFESVFLYLKYIIHPHSFLLSFLNSNVFSSLHNKNFGTDEKVLVEMMNRLLYNTSLGVIGNITGNIKSIFLLLECFFFVEKILFWKLIQFRYFR